MRRRPKCHLRQPAAATIPEKQGKVRQSKRRRKTMSEFTYLFRGRDTSASPEQMQKTMEKWVAWFKDLGANGQLKEPGHPLEHTGKVVMGKQKIVNDGPYA